MGKPSPKQQERPLTRGLRSAVRNDASAFSYSILITVTFGAVQLEVGSVSAGRLFLFVLGSTGAFALIEAASSRFFQVRVREEPSDVVILGTALAPLSVALALLAALATLQVVAGAPAWALTPAVATTVYICTAACQLMLARSYEQRNPPDEEG